MDRDDGSHAPGVGPRSILLVDDDERVLKFVSKMLLSFRQEEVFQACSAQEAFKIWNDCKSKIWLVISDFVMPMVTGDAMVARMVSEQSELKVLFISGNDPSSLDSAIPLDDRWNFLRKPFTIMDLRQRLQRLESA